MRAQPGDWIVIEGHTTGVTGQRGRIMEVHSDDGSPPFVVQWLSDEHTSVFFPGPDARVLTAGELAEADERARKRFDAVQAELSGKA
ncbi:MAG TPA: DUF1918 domain-containing protein [Mycobacteriales bacterium]|nr:DUF1918 domain-containing protein [Mycobacteriales bacterium]